MIWTEKDALRAKQEGWKYLGGYVTRTYDQFGGANFLGTNDVIEHLYRNSKKSEWHRSVYLALPWSIADSTIAMTKGWGLKLTVDTAAIIFKPLNIFSSDEAAQEHVQQQALAGDALCIKALSTLAKVRLKHG